MVKELRKVKTNGEKYTRQPSVQKILSEFDGLSPELISRKCICDRVSVPSEVLVHLLRNASIGLDTIQLKVVFDILVSRVQSILWSKVDDQQYDHAFHLREEILGELIELIARDRSEQGTMLDYYEVNFNHAFKCLRVSYLRKSCLANVKSVPLTVEYDEVIDISPEVEARMGEIINLESSKWEDPSFRFALLAAIDKLPLDQKQVVGLLLQGMPIESIDESVMTISRALNCTDRTVRNRKNRAFEALREALVEELL
jgi:hypothetical protein